MADINWMTVVNSLISATAGLGGVGLGAYLTHQREQAKEDTSIGRELSYLAILVSAQLDNLVEVCIAIAADDGSDEYGAPSTDYGEYRPTTSAPEFDPSSLDLNWKIVPLEVMDEVLLLPTRLRRTHRAAYASGWEQEDAPDYSEGFYLRQKSYAELGLYVFSLARRLRKAAGLPTSGYAGVTERPDEWFQRRVAKIAEERAESEARYAERQKAQSLNSSMIAPHAPSLTSGQLPAGTAVGPADAVAAVSDT